MKKLFLAATFAIAGITVANAQEATTAGQQSNTTTQTEQTTATQATAVTDSVSKTAIKVEELPAAIQDVLKADPYKAWTPTAAFMVKDVQAQKEWYQVDVKKDQETASVNFDKEGKPLQ